MYQLRLHIIKNYPEFNIFYIITYRSKTNQLNFKKVVPK